MGLDQALRHPTIGERPRVDLEAGRLVGSRCDECQAVAWPGRAVCHRCGSAEVRESRFATTATMRTCTEVMVGRPGLDVPYWLAQVVVDDSGPVLFGRLTGMNGAPDLPCPVDVKTGVDSFGAPTYWFEPR
ncbi:Zn-ribbon domain-containing OB-fold protein [Amycolatopsis jejuensis]|uniref:Zn-ribbon domain-containing OB-fold protein n=1 Tax=Amycolatopsis jejuensis TaxID=330084 RepID=UPI000524BAC0|nr:zinc ribbon domain-containing protein [Amycolatopsis jejuensis]